MPPRRHPEVRAQEHLGDGRVDLARERLDGNVGEREEEAGGCAEHDARVLVAAVAPAAQDQHHAESRVGEDPYPQRDDHVSLGTRAPMSTTISVGAPVAFRRRSGRHRLTRATTRARLHGATSRLNRRLTRRPPPRVGASADGTRGKSMLMKLYICWSTSGSAHHDCHKAHTALVEPATTLKQSRPEGRNICRSSCSSRSAAKFMP